jgi:ribonuclease HI
MSKINLTIYSDGGARGNPGSAAIGVVIYDGDKIVKKISKTIGETTNNQAEYQALIAGLKKAQELGANTAKCFLDSELVVSQVTGKYKVKEPRLQEKVAEVLKLTNKFDSVDFKHVPREKNQLADALVNKALDNER